MIAYLNGEWKPLEECQVRIDTQALQYGTGCFEGIRGYWDGSRINLLFLREHFQRLYRNARMLLMQSPSIDEMCELSLRLVRDNDLACNVYLRPMVFKRGFGLGPTLHGQPDGFLLYCLKLEEYFASSGGLQVCVSSWDKYSDNSIPTRAKANGAYISSALARSEASLNGYDEAIFLNNRGEVAEGSAENVFLVRDGVLITPDKTAGILEGITRAAMLQLAAEAGVPVEERAVARSELYVADEVFLVGTGCQVMPVAGVDRRQIGDGGAGPITTRLRQMFLDGVYGRAPAKAHWLTPVG